MENSSTDCELHRQYLQSSASQGQPSDNTYGDTYSYSITKAHTGTEGLKRWQQQQPDVVLLDYTLPDLHESGFISALQAQNQTTVALVDSDAIAHQAIELGAQDYLVKNHITPTRLRLTINRTSQSAELKAALQKQTKEGKLAHQQSAGALQKSELRLRQLTEDVVEAQKALQQSEEFKDRILASSSDCIKVLDLQANLLYINEAGICRLEIENAALCLGSNWLDFWQGDDKPQAVEAFESAKAGKLGKFRGFSPTMKGKPKWWDVIVTPIRDGAGQVTQILSTSRDVSRRKQVQLELRSQTKLLQTIVNSIGDGLIAANQQGEFIAINEAAHRMFGQLSNDEPYEDWAKTYGLYLPDQKTLIPQEELPLFKAMQGESVTVEMFVRSSKRKEGRWINVSGYPLIDESNEISGGIIVCQDVTSRKHTAADLRQKNAILETINQSAPTPIFVKNRKGQIIYANSATLDVLERPAEEVIGRYDSDLYPHPEDAANVMENDQRIMDAGKTEVVEESPDGIRTFLGTKAPYQNEKGEVIGLIGIANDITERVQIERDREHLLQQQQKALTELERINTMKDDFFAVLSHELRSPLNPILGWAKLLQSRQFDEDKLRIGLQTIERNAKAQCQLVDDLLDMAKVTQGKLSINTLPVRLSTAIESALDTVHAAATKKSITIHSNLSEMGYISGDIIRLQQIVWNLLTNAIKFTPDNGRIDVTLEQTNGFATMTITDTGRGISDSFLPHIFESFRQEDASVTRGYGGLGLGMTIVYQLVAAHNGTIVANSPGENQGATFTVQIPLLNRGATITQTDSPPTLDSHLTGIRALIIDDEPDSLEFTATVLAQAGAKVLAIGSPAKSISAAGSFRPNIILSDIGMPEIDGHTLLPRVKEQLPDKGESVAAIALTAYASEVDQQRAIAAGFDQHIAKPIDPEQLISVIAILVNSQRTA
ncbi:MAG: PAS domain-containing protein [Cyanobacteria bacterium P01_D01_bin.36]